MTDLTYTFRAIDTYGDGWSGWDSTNKVDITLNGIVVYPNIGADWGCNCTSLTEKDYPFGVNYGDTISLQNWFSTLYSYEVKWQIIDNNGVIQASGDYGDIPSVQVPPPPSESTGSIVFDMEGPLYNNLKALGADDPQVQDIVKKSLLSIFGVSNLTLESLQFNSIDAGFTATGVFDATNFKIYMSDQENVVNAFVAAANEEGLGPYNSTDLTLTGVDSRGEITDSDGNVTAFTCFAAGSIVETDQGNIAIEKINKNKHTINGKKIVALTKNILGGKEIVSIKKDALGKNMPSQNTLVSPNHLISYQGEMKEAKWIAKNVAGASFVPYQKEVLYNILMEQYDEMRVNNMVTETLHPNNLVAKLHRDYTFLERQKLINEFNKSVKENGYNTAKKMFKKRI